jgi:hypothetical protein
MKSELESIIEAIFQNARREIWECEIFTSEIKDVI